MSSSKKNNKSIFFGLLSGAIAFSLVSFLPVYADRGGRENERSKSFFKHYDDHEDSYEDEDDDHEDSYEDDGEYFDDEDDLYDDSDIFYQAKYKDVVFLRDVVKSETSTTSTSSVSNIQIPLIDITSITTYGDVVRAVSSYKSALGVITSKIAPQDTLSLSTANVLATDIEVLLQGVVPLQPLQTLSSSERDFFQGKIISFGNTLRVLVSTMVKVW